MTAKPQNKPTLAEMVRDWRDVEYWEYDVSGEKVASICANEITAFHARAKALAEFWESESKRCYNLAHKGTRVEQSVMAQSVRFWSCAKELREILGDLKP